MSPILTIFQQSIRLTINGLVVAVALLLTVLPGRWASAASYHMQDEPPETTVVLVAELAGLTVTESFVFQPTEISSFSVEPVVAVKLARDHLTLSIRATKGHENECRFDALFKADEAEAANLDAAIRVKETFQTGPEGKRQKMIRATDRLVFVEIEEFEQKRPKLFQDFEKQILFFNALKIYSQLPEFRLVKTDK